MDTHRQSLLVTNSCPITLLQWLISIRFHQTQAVLNKRQVIVSNWLSSRRQPNSAVLLMRQQTMLVMVMITKIMMNKNSNRITAINFNPATHYPSRFIIRQQSQFRLSKRQRRQLWVQISRCWSSRASSLPRFNLYWYPGLTVDHLCLASSKIVVLVDWQPLVAEGLWWVTATTWYSHSSVMLLHLVEGLLLQLLVTITSPLIKALLRASLVIRIFAIWKLCKQVQISTSR